MLYLGIDPGMSGGIALIYDDEPAMVMAHKMPETERDLLMLIVGATSGHRCRALIERVWSSPQMGVSSAFKFGFNTGLCRMALVAAKVPFEDVLPQQWQKAMGCRSGRSQFVGGDKNITKRKAQGLFPDLTVTHAIADALLIAEFCRRIHTGTATLPANPVRERSSNGEEGQDEAGAQEGKGAKARSHRHAARHGGSRHP